MTIFWIAQLLVTQNSCYLHCCRGPDGLKQFVGLGAKKCVPCEAGKAKPLEDAQINTLRNQVPGWRVTGDAKGIKCLRQVRRWLTACVYCTPVAASIVVCYLQILCLSGTVRLISSAEQHWLWNGTLLLQIFSNIAALKVSKSIDIHKDTGNALYVMTGRIRTTASLITT